MSVSALIVAFVMVGELIVGLVSVLLVKVCTVVFCVTEEGNVGVPPIVYVPASVPENVGLEIVGDVSVLFVSVWESVSPTGWEDKLRKVLRLIFCTALKELVQITNSSLTASIVLALGYRFN